MEFNGTVETLTEQLSKQVPNLMWDFSPLIGLIVVTSMFFHILRHLLDFERPYRRSFFEDVLDVLEGIGEAIGQGVTKLYRKVKPLPPPVMTTAQRIRLLELQEEAKWQRLIEVEKQRMNEWDAEFARWQHIQMQKVGWMRNGDGSLRRYQTATAESGEGLYK